MTGDEGDSNRLINDDISLVALGNPDEFPRVADYGQRRYRALHRDFDMRANSLAFPIQEFWDEKVKAIHREIKRE